MSIADPISYADWYWKHSVEAQKYISEHAEQSYAPVIQQIADSIGLTELLPNALRPFYGHLVDPESPDWDALQRPVLALYNRALSLVVGEEIARPTTYALRAATPTLKMDPNMAAILTQRKKMSHEVFNVYAGFAGYDDNESRDFYASRLPYPAIPDIITASRYLGDPSDAKSHAQSLFDIPDDDYMVWDWLTYQKLTTEQVLQLYRMGHWDDGPTDTELARLGWRLDDSRAVKNLAYEVPNAMLLMQSGLVQSTAYDTIIENISKAGINPSYAEDYYQAILTKPATEDIIAYQLRQDASLTNLPTELQKIGIHPNYHGVYKELAYQIPPIADIITMAVREAFTPSIAARFGQYQDLPPDLVEWAGKKGLSREWAERYWAAHWSLPSPQQGFEMLHRGVIGTDDLNMLLRALDVMPFWRDKLTQIAYRPLSRVDVRRMFKLGVLDVGGIKKAYTDIGYNEYNANLMTQFTIEYTKGVPKKLPTADIVSAYKKHLIDSATLASQLANAGLDSEDIGPIVSTAQQKREWSDKEDSINTIEYLYKQGRDTLDQTLIKLRVLQLSESYISSLIPQWTAKSQAEKETLWTNAQTLGFMKAGLITIERGRQELTDLGYDEEHINVYIAAAQSG